MGWYTYCKTNDGNGEQVGGESQAIERTGKGLLQGWREWLALKWQES